MTIRLFLAGAVIVPDRGRDRGRRVSFLCCINPLLMARDGGFHVNFG